MIEQRTCISMISLAMALLAGCGNPAIPSSVTDAPTSAPTRLISIPTQLPAAIPSTPVSAAPSATPAATSAPTAESKPIEISTATSAPPASTATAPATIVLPRENPAARLATGIPVQRPLPGRPEAIRIYGLDQGNASTARSPAQYRSDVERVVTAHLAKQLGIPETDISLVEGSNQEVALAMPCGAGRRDSARRIDAGLAPGYQVTLAAAGARYRYVAVRGLAYVCGAV